MTRPTAANISALMVAHVERELAALLATDSAADDAAAALSQAPAPAPGSRTRPGSSNGSSVVFTVRLDPLELDALQRRAAARGLPASALARNLIRIGLQPASPSDQLAPAAERLEAALAGFLDVLRTHRP